MAFQVREEEAGLVLYGSRGGAILHSECNVVGRA